MATELRVEGEAGASRPIELLRALAVLAEHPTREHAAVALSLSLGSPPDPASHAAVFLFELPPYASIYLGAEGMLGGDALDRIAGFWAAVGRTVPPEPDHLSALLGLYAGLLEEGEREGGAEAALSLRSAAALFHEHLSPWVFPWLAHVAERADGFYAPWARLLDRTLSAEATWAGFPAALSAHQRGSPGLADPRSEGGDAFLGSLLAPMRSGMIVARTDLARGAASLGLGMRVGERRYVLRNLLGQDATGTLNVLAGMARRARDLHGARRPLLGETAAFLQSRAAATAELLDELARGNVDADLGGATP